MESGKTDSSCSNVQLQVGAQRRVYESISNNITVYRRINSKGFTMRCQCINNESEFQFGQFHLIIC